MAKMLNIMQKIGIIAVLFILVGCQSITNDKDNGATSDTDYPITITHALGTTTITSKPEKIATISWGNQDVPLALGVVPIGFSEANYGVIDGSSMLPWTKQALSDLGVTSPNIYMDYNGLDFEAIAASAPDVILAAYSGITQEDYDLLSQIAPVVAYPVNAWQTAWRDQITIDATGMGMAAEGKALVGELEALIETKLDEYDNIAGKTAAFIYFTPTDLSSFYIYLPTDPRAGYLEDLGLVLPETILALADSSAAFSVQVSAENADVLNDVDIIICYGYEGLVETLQADTLLKTVPAVQNAAIVQLENNTPLAAASTPSALSIPYSIDEYLTLISEAAAKVQ